MSDCPTALLLWAEGLNIGPLQEGEHGPGHLPRATGRAEVWCYRLSETPPNSSCLRVGGRSQLRAGIWSWCHLMSLQGAAAAATSKPVHSSPLLVPSCQLSQALQRSSDTDDTDVNTDTCMYSHTHSPHESEWR